MRINCEVIKRVEEDHRVAYRVKAAAEALGISYTTLWREMKAKRLFRFRDYPVIAREELLRFAREQTRLARESEKPKRVPRSEYRALK